MSPSAPLDPASLNLSQFLSGMARDIGGAGAGRSVSVASASVSVATAAKSAPAEATEVTDDIKSGETDAEKLSKLRIPTTVAPPIIAVTPTPTAVKVQRASGGLYVAIFCAAIIVLGLMAGVALFLMQGP
jgi:hypothetical protein